MVKSFIKIRCHPPYRRYFSVILKYRPNLYMNTAPDITKQNKENVQFENPIYLVN